MNEKIKELAEQAGLGTTSNDAWYPLPISLIHIVRFAELVAAAERDKFWDALMSDLEHGVKSLNDRASERFAKEYPALNREFNGDKHE